jgi:hypothetical protein
MYVYVRVCGVAVIALDGEEGWFVESQDDGYFGISGRCARVGGWEGTPAEVEVVRDVEGDSRCGFDEI